MYARQDPLPLRERSEPWLVVVNDPTAWAQRGQATEEPAREVGVLEVGAVDSPSPRGILLCGLDTGGPSDRGRGGVGTGVGRHGGGGGHAVHERGALVRGEDRGGPAGGVEGGGEGGPAGGRVGGSSSTSGNLLASLQCRLEPCLLDLRRAVRYSGVPHQKHCPAKGVAPLRRRGVGHDLQHRVAALTVDVVVDRRRDGADDALYRVV